MVELVVLGHGASVVLELGDVVGTPGGNVVGSRVLVVVVGHGPTPPPGSGQSTCVVVVVVGGSVAGGGCPPTQPYLASQGARAWRTNARSAKAVSTSRSAVQMRAWNGPPAAWADAPGAEACIWMTPTPTARSSTTRRRAPIRRRCFDAGAELSGPLVCMPPRFRPRRCRRHVTKAGVGPRKRDILRPTSPGRTR